MGRLDILEDLAQGFEQLYYFRNIKAKYKNSAIGFKADEICKNLYKIIMKDIRYFERQFGEKIDKKRFEVLK